MFSEVKKNMMGRNHLLLGLGLYGGTILAFDIHQDSSILMGCLASAGLGSLLPDIDSPHSYIGRKFWPVSWVVSSAVRHRGVTHSLFALLFLLGILCLAYFWKPGPSYLPYYEAFWIGYASHILGDWITKEGVPLFWPSKKRFRSPVGFATNSVGENIFGILLALGVFGIFKSFLN